MKEKTFIAVTRCLVVHKQHATFHFKGVYFGASIKSISVINASAFQFARDVDYVLRLRQVEIIDGGLKCVAEKAKRLEDFSLF